MSGLFGYVIVGEPDGYCSLDYEMTAAEAVKCQSLPSASLSQDHTNLDDHIFQTSLVILFD